MTRINGTDRVLTGWGRTAPSRACVAGPMETSQLQEIIAAYGQLADWREVRELLDPRKVFSSDLGRRLGLC